MAEQISYLIIGNGIAGVTAAEILRTEDSAATIAVIADDPFPVYYRPALKDYLAGRVYEDKLWARPSSFYQDHKIHFLPERVTGIQAGQHTVQLGNGRQVAYGRLLLATGARPGTLRCPGTNLEGVTTLRTVADYQEVMAYLNKVQRVVVCGSGTLALETIETLRHRGYEVTHLIRRRTLWSDVLDSTASDLVLQQERRDGVEVLLEEEIAEIKGNKQGKVTGVVTRSGERIACEAVIIAIGVEPNIDFIKASGISCGRGVRVDNLMRTSAPDIYAAGDVLETTDPLTRRTRILGQWYPAIQQARAAAYSMLDLLDSEQQFSFSAFYNATFLYGLDFAAVGATNLSGYQEIVADPQPRMYHKVLLKDGVPVGMLSLGERKQALAFKRAIDHRVNLLPVASRLFERNFKLSDWLDSQKVPPAMLGVQRAGNRVVKQAAYALGNTSEPLKAVKVAAPTEAALLHVPDRVTGLKLPEVLLSQTKVIAIGRQPGVPLLIDQGSVSRRHAEISYANGQYILNDLGSTNGTFVNDERVEPDKPHVLKSDELLRFGKLVTFRFVLRALPPKTASASPGGANMAGVTRLYDLNVTGQLQPSSQPVLNEDGSLQLPGAATPIPASVIESCKETPALIVLTGKEGQRAPQVVMLKQGRHIFLGRDQNNDIMLADAEVSRRHAEVFPGPDGFYIRDLDSSNGVIVNQTKISNPYLLTQGDHMRIGDSVLYFIDLRSGWRSTEQVPAQRPAQPEQAKRVEQLVPAGGVGESGSEPSATKPLGYTSRVKVCNNCGVVNTSVARFCAGCSAPLGSAVSGKLRG